MSTALSSCMSMRTFVDAAGARWSVWETEARKSMFLAARRQRCLSFVDEAGAERGRLFDVPPNWEELSAQRLEALRHYAQPVYARNGISVEITHRFDERLAGADSPRGL